MKKVFFDSDGDDGGHYPGTVLVLRWGEKGQLILNEKRTSITNREDHETTADLCDASIAFSLAVGRDVDIRNSRGECLTALLGNADVTKGPPPGVTINPIFQQLTVCIALCCGVV